MATKFITPSWRMPKNSNQSKASNYSIDFDGATQFIDLGTGVEILPGQPNPSGGQNISNPEWSVSSFVNFSALGAQSCIVSTGRGGGSTYWDFRKNASNKIEGYFRTSSGGYTTITGDTTVTSGTWYHVCITWSNGNLNLYLNGVSDCDAVSATNFYFAGDGFLPLSTIGRFRYGTGGSQGRDQFDGKLDHVAIFNYGLDSNAVTTLWGGGIPGNPLAIKPPIAYYNLGQGSAYAEGSAGIVEPNLAAATGSTVFEFDGPNANEQYITTTYFPNGESNFTYSTWVNCNFYQQGAPLAAYGGSTHQNFYIVFWTDTGGVMYVYVGGVYAVFANFALHGYPINRWTNISVVYDGTFTDADTATQNAGRLKLYINGNYEAFNSFSGTIPSTIPSGNTGFYLGTTTPTTYEYGGKMSNVQMWNTTLSASNLTTLYNNGTPLQSYTDVPQSGSLKAWYKLGLDTSTYEGSYWDIGNSTANYSSALNFDGVNPGGLSAGNVWNLSDGWSPFTISFWYKGSNPLDGSTHQQSMFEFAPTGNSQIGFYDGYNGVDNIRLHLILKTSYSNKWKVGANGTVNMFDNKWHNVIIVFPPGEYGGADAAASTLYIDNQLITKESSGNVDPPTGFYSFKKFDIMKGQWGSLPGQLSNLVLWTTDQTSERANIYNNGTPATSYTNTPLGWWKLNNTTTGIQDLGSGANNLTNNGATKVNTLVSTLNGTSEGMDTTNLVPSNLQKSIPYSGYSMNFDAGDSDYIEIPNNSSLQFTDQLTFSCWVKANNVSGTNTILDKYWLNATENKRSYMLRITSTTVRLTLGDASGLYQQQFTSNTTLSNGVWYNIIITFKPGSPSNLVNMYINGVSDANNPQTKNDTISTNTQPLRIGGGYNLLNYFDGIISNVAVWDRAITEDEILRVYNGGVPGDLTNLGPTSWWSLGADSYFASNWICPDIGANTNNGTSTNMAEVNLVGNGPDSLANGTSTNLDLASDLIGEAPGSTGNAISINMNSLARTGSTP